MQQQLNGGHIMEVRENVALVTSQLEDFGVLIIARLQRDIDVIRD
jgi:hypothetical protein